MWQHWASGTLSANVKAPFLCIGAREGCIFHDEPLKFRSSKSYLMNVVVYPDGQVHDRHVKILSANKIFESIFDQARVARIPLDSLVSHDVIVTKRGGGLRTVYDVSVLATTLEPGEVDLETLPDQEPSFACVENPKLVDYRLFESLQAMTPDEQGIWYDRMMSGDDEASPIPIVPANVPVAIAPDPRVELQCAVEASEALSTMSALKSFIALSGSSKGKVSLLTNEEARILLDIVKGGDDAIFDAISEEDPF